MKRVSIGATCLLGLLATAIVVGGRGSTSAKTGAKEYSGDWSTHELAEVFAAQRKSGTPWQQILDEPTLAVGLYALPQGGKDRQTAHRRDEVYHVISGTAMLRVDGPEGGEYKVSPGSVIFVKAGVDHRFHDIEEELRVLVFFSQEQSVVERTTATPGG